MLIRLATPPAVPLSSSIHEPAARAVFCSVPEHVVAPSIPLVPPLFEQATPPEEAVANAATVKLAPVPATLRRTITLGVPASAATVSSTTVEAAGIKHRLPCGPRSEVASAAPLSVPTTIE